MSGLFHCAQRHRQVFAYAGFVNTTTDSVPHASGDVGEYKLLHKYLNNRFADRVVLTFGQIEDILGFSLPVPAWVEREWWGCLNALGSATRQSAAWTLAGRSATVNLAARSVTFEREVAASSGAY